MRIFAQCYKYIKFNYGNLSEIVKRLLQKYDVKIVFRINSKFDRFITFGKDPHEI